MPAATNVCAVKRLCTGVRERKAMAASFATLPAKVLWRLALSEVPDEAAIAELGIGSNTKVALQCACVSNISNIRRYALLRMCHLCECFEHCDCSCGIKCLVHGLQTNCIVLVKL